MRYSVGIPTCDRFDALTRTVVAFKRQTVLPESIAIINNNTDRSPMLLTGPIWDHVVTLPNLHPTRGPEQAHQAFLDFIKRTVEIAVRFDDDLLPEPDCMEKMLRHFEDSTVNCVGGCYPREGKPVWEGGPCGGRPSPDGDPNHIQFYRWGSWTKPVRVNSLYSGFMYRVKEMIEAGGFYTGYSKLGFRGETDATLRLGGCLVDPEACATHLLAAGGVRSFTEAERIKLEAHDNALFGYRMNALKIDTSKGHVRVLA